MGAGAKARAAADDVALGQQRGLHHRFGRQRQAPRFRHGASSAHAHGGRGGQPGADGEITTVQDVEAGRCFGARQQSLQHTQGIVAPTLLAARGQRRQRPLQHGFERAGGHAHHPIGAQPQGHEGATVNGAGHDRPAVVVQMRAHGVDASRREPHGRGRRTKAPLEGVCVGLQSNGAGVDCHGLQPSKPRALWLGLRAREW